MSASGKRFIKFVERNREVLPLLPVVHTTNVATFSRILDDGVISVHMCKVYKTELCYFFYGKPTYQIKKKSGLATKIIGDAAVCFLIKPSFVKLLRLFPFDTGACYGKRYDNYLPTGITVEDFEMPATLQCVTKFVGAFFESNRNYYYGIISNTNTDVVSKLDLVSEVIIGLATARASDTFDERCCSCEIQTAINIPLESSTIESIVIPDVLADDEEVMVACAQWGIKPILYHFKMATPESRTEVICDKVGEFYDRRGYF